MALMDGELMRWREALGAHMKANKTKVRYQVWWLGKRYKKHLPIS
jgi:hypothetical protein